MVQAVDGIELHTGAASLVLKNNGQIEIRGVNIIFEGSSEVVIKSPAVSVYDK